MNGRIGALLLVLLLPACALAVTEGVVEEAPQIELEPAQEAPFLQTNQLMEAYRDRAREVLGQHMGREEAMAFCYHRLMNAAFDYDGQGDPGNGRRTAGFRLSCPVSPIRTAAQRRLWPLTGRRATPYPTNSCAS